MFLYVSNNGPCAACDRAKKTVTRWGEEGRLAHAVSIKPIPSTREFETFVRSKTGGRWGYPLLFDPQSQSVVLGFSERRYEQILCT